jgi:hypothetical protein
MPGDGVEESQAVTQAFGSGVTITFSSHEPSEHGRQEVGLEHRQSVAVRKLSTLFFLISNTANSSAV